MSWTTVWAARESRAMSQIAPDTACVQMLVLDRIEPAANMSRYYVLSIQPTLWGEQSLVRHWGRIGGQGRSRIDLHRDETSAAEALETWLERKRRRGYVPRQPITQVERRYSGP